MSRNIGNIDPVLLEKVRVEKTIYQPNKLSNTLIMLVIMINVFFVLQILNVIDKDIHIGFHVLFNIFLTLLLFLSAVRIKVYKMGWTYVVLGFGAFQILRGFFMIPSEVVDNQRLILMILLVLSGVLAIIAGWISYIKINKQKKYIIENNYHVEKLAK